MRHPRVIAALMGYKVDVSAGWTKLTFKTKHSVVTHCLFQSAIIKISPFPLCTSLICGQQLYNGSVCHSTKNVPPSVCHSFCLRRRKFDMEVKCVGVKLCVVLMPISKQGVAARVASIIVIVQEVFQAYSLIMNKRVDLPFVQQSFFLKKGKASFSQPLRFDRFPISHEML